MYDTQLTPVLFEDGSDRRTSARIPLSTPVKIGPPNGTPYASVSATDLSKGGLFIDADRPVRVGARFSAEIELSHDRIYIPEAEVAYNRDRITGSGFGVRFVSMDPEALAAVAEEIDRVTDQTLIVRSKKSLSDLPTLVPSERPSQMGVELSHYPEPEIIDEGLDLQSVIQAGSIPAGDESIPLERAQAGLRETRQRFLERAKSAPSIFRILAITGSFGLVASAAFALANGAGGDAVAPAYDPTEHGVAASTHQVLMGKQSLAALDKPRPAVEPAAIEDPKLRRKMLPPLLVLDEEKIEGKVRPKNASKVDAKLEAKTAPKGSVIRLEGVDPGARVLESHVYRSPDRFVIDLAGQTGDLSIPPVTGPARGVRTGRHPEFFRVVIDAEAGLEAGRVSSAGGALLVDLIY